MMWCDDNTTRHGKVLQQLRENEHTPHNFHCGTPKITKTTKCPSVRLNLATDNSRVQQ